jgi:hypothetical protein
MFGIYVVYIRNISDMLQVYIYDIFLVCASGSQDCLATISPYQHYTDDCGADFMLHHPFLTQTMWIVRLQLFFSCTLRLLNTSKSDRHNRCEEDIPLDLVFFSAFENFRLQTTDMMESNLSCPYSVCWQGGGPQWAAATLSLLP